MDSANLDNIERYLDGDMQPEERRSFEASRRSNRELDRMVRLLEEAREHLHYRQEDEQLRRMLSAAGKEHFQAPGPRLSRRRFPVMLLAAATLTGIFLLFWWMRSHNRSSENLYQTYAAHPQPALVARSQDATLRSQAEQFLKNKQYDAALPVLNQLRNTEPNDPELQLFYGISLLENKQGPEAAAVFRELAAGGPESYRNIALWYQALTALKQGDRESGIAYLQAISSDSEWYPKAQNLLKDWKD